MPRKTLRNSDLAVVIIIDTLWVKHCNFFSSCSCRRRMRRPHSLETTGAPRSPRSRTYPKSDGALFLRIDFFNLLMSVNGGYPGGGRPGFCSRRNVQTFRMWPFQFFQCGKTPLLAPAER